MLPRTYQLHAAAKLRGCVLKADFLPLMRRLPGLLSGAATSSVFNQRAYAYRKNALELLSDEDYGGNQKQTTRKL